MQGMRDAQIIRRVLDDNETIGELAEATNRNLEAYDRLRERQDVLHAEFAEIRDELHELTTRFERHQSQHLTETIGDREA
jgi:uncharacterized coiled-coil DUF342 family protein